MKKLLVIALSLMCMFVGITVVGCGGGGTNYTITLSESKVMVEEFSTYQLSATVKDGETVLTDKILTWASNDTTIATVSADGLIKGVSEGETTITCSLEDKTAVCNVSVGKYEIKLELSRTDVQMSFEEGYTFDLTATATKNGENINVTPTWSSSNDKVATVENGKVTVKGEGECFITVKTVDSNGFYVCARCKLLVGSETTDADKNDVTAPDIDWAING